MTIQAKVLSELGQAALGYAQMGWHVLPLAPNSKIPLISARMGGKGYKDATDNPDQICTWWTATPNANIGISCAASGLVVVDPDLYKEDCEWNVFVQGRDLPDTLVQSTVSGGKHFVFKAPTGAEFAGGPCKGVDTKHHGYIVVEPSVIDGKSYSWDNDNEPAPVPDWVPRKGTSQSTGQVQPSRTNVDRMVSLLSGSDVHDNSRDLIASFIAKGMTPEITGDIARAAIIVGTPASLRRDERLARVSYHVDTAREKYGSDNTYRHTGLNLVRDDKERPVWCLANAVSLMTTHPAWIGVLGFDQFAQRKVLMRPIQGEATAGEWPRAVTDDDYTAATAWFNRNGFPRAGSDTCAQALRAACGHNSFDPLGAYLKSLTWDSKPRVRGWLQAYCGATPSNTADAEYLNEIGLRWMISAVARGLQPGCKADCMLVLEGPQGARKSSALRALAGPEWFSDSLPQMGTKDASSYLRGRWIVEVAELEAMRREQDAIKAFLTRQVETFRPAYGREEVNEPRRCIFAGTTNKDDWHNDETGGRRFWPVRIGKIDIDAIRTDRDQLWAEAVHLYQAGEPWWLHGKAAKTASDAIAQRGGDDPWLAEVARAVAGRTEITAKEVLVDIGLLPKDQTLSQAKRAAAALVALGYTRVGRSTSKDTKGQAIFRAGEDGVRMR